MKNKFRINETVFLSVYLLFALSLSAVLILLHDYDFLLTLLLIPLIYAALFNSRRSYLTAMFIGIGSSFLVIYFVAYNFLGSVQTTVSVWFVFFLGYEFIRFMFSRQRELEEALRESEEKYRNLFNNIPIPAYSTDLQTGELLQCNEALARYLDLKNPEEVIRRKIRLADYYGWDKRSELMKRMLANEKMVNIEMSFLKNGVMCHLLGSAILSKNRKYYEGCFVDVTEYKQIFNSLKESEERFRALVETTSDWVWEVNSNLVYTYVSPKVRDMLGYEPAEVLGKTPFHIMPMEEIRTIEKKIAPIIQNRRPLIGLENICLHKNGQAVVLETNGVPFFDAEGNYCGYRGIDRDITQRKQIENALRESENKLRAIVDHSTNLFYSHTPDHVITYFSPRTREFFDCEPEEALTCWMNFLTDNPINEKGFELTQRALETGQPQPPYILELVGKKGRKIWVEVHETPVVQNGEIQGIVGALIDITERKQAEAERNKFAAQMQQAQKLESLGILAGGIAHDFNNLLVGILGNAELGLRNTASELPGRGYFEDILKAGQRAAELINQLLAYAGKGPFKIEPVDLNKLIEEMSQLWLISISKKNTLVKRFTEPLPAIQADTVQLRQVIMNLIFNAADAIGDSEGVITLRTGILEATRNYLSDAYMSHGLAEGTYVYFEVSDTGCGMDLETQNRMFDPFFTTKLTGRGLGLAAVLGIVRGHRGAIKVTSEAGKGSVFKVLFPGFEHPISEKPVSEISSWLTWRGSGTILVVDDEDTVLIVTKTVLENLGFSVRVARDGWEGVESFRQNQQDIALILLDMTMPRMNGEEAFREIRSIRKEIPIILTSGYSEEDATKSLVGKERFEFLQKPFLVKSLIEKIRCALEIV